MPMWIARERSRFARRDGLAQGSRFDAFALPPRRVPNPLMCSLHQMGRCSGAGVLVALLLGPAAVHAFVQKALPGERLGPRLLRRYDRAGLCPTNGERQSPGPYDGLVCGCIAGGGLNSVRGLRRPHTISMQKEVRRWWCCLEWMHMLSDLCCHVAGSWWCPTLPMSRPRSTSTARACTRPSGGPPGKLASITPTDKTCLGSQGVTLPFS
jgi:hypothetical protein